MDESERRGGALVHEVRVVAVEPPGEHHPLVAEGSGRERYGVAGLAGRESLPRHRRHHDLAHHEELALECVFVRAALPAADEYLPDPGLGRLDALAEDGRIHRYVPPSQEVLALGRGGGGERFLAGAPRRLVPRQEHHAHSIMAGSGEIEAEPGALVPEKGIGDLDEDPGPVAGERIRPDRPPVGDVAEELEPLAEEVMARPVADVHDEPDAA